MFDELDDPTGFRPDDRFRAGVAQRTRQLRHRRRGRRLAGASAALVVAAVLAAGLVVLRRDAAIDRVDVVTNPSTDGAVNVLLLGSDGGGLGDTAIIVRFDEDGGLAVLTIPRDLWVERADGSGGSRINQALTDGGADGYVTALDRATGIPVDHVVEISFEGFRGLVDSVGGLRVGIAADLRDVHVGLHLAQVDCTTLDGTTALQLVRSRYLQFREPGGDWQADPTADLGRSGRAQLLSGIVLQQLVALDPGIRDLDRLSQVLADHATLDDGLTLPRVVELARRLLAADGVEATGLPVEPYTDANGASLLRRIGGDDVVRRFGAVDPPPPAVPAPLDGMATGEGLGLLATRQLQPCS